MAVTSGFFDGINHDRRYTAEQWGHIMDYLIMDGVYAYYPETGVTFDDSGVRNKTLPPFKVTPLEGRDAWKAPNGYAVSVGPGRAWFDGTWTHVSTPEIVTLDPPDPAGDRIDAICLQMNKSAPVRANRLVVKKAKQVYTDGGEMSLAQYLPLTPKPGDTEFPTGGGSRKDYNTLKNFYPELQGHYMHGDEVHDVPLAFIFRRKDAERIESRDIYTAVGTAECPYVTNIADGAFSVEDVYLNWSTQFDDFWDSFQDRVDSEYQAWHDGLLALDPQWRGWLDNRAADFMRWLKVYDRAYHVWYQGSVNWTYEYIRNLQSENEDFEAKWSDAIQKAQDLLENGLGEYTQKIEELTQKMADVDNLVDGKMQELQQELDSAIDGIKTEIQNGVKEVVTEVITEQMTTIVEKVVESAGPDIRQELKDDVQNMLRDELSDTFDERLKDLEAKLDQYAQDLQGSVSRTIENLMQEYTLFQENIQQVINQAVTEQLQELPDLQPLLEQAVESGVREEVINQLQSNKEPWVTEIKTELAEGIQLEIDRIFEEKFETEKTQLIDYVKEQVHTITDTAVDERFNADFATKQTELEAKINEYATSTKQELAEALVQEVQRVFDEQFENKYAELSETLAGDITTAVDGMKTDVRADLQQSLSDSLTESLTQVLTEKNQDNKTELTEGLTIEVQNKFNEQFADKQTELEQKITESVDTGVNGLEGQLDEKVDAKFESVKEEVAAAAEQLVTERIDKTLSSVFKFKGTGPFEHLPSVLDSSMEGNVYNVKDAFTTDDRFVEGAGQDYFAGTNVVVVDAGQPEFDPGMPEGPSVVSEDVSMATAEGSVYKFDIFPGFVDLSPYATTEALNALQQQVTELSGSISTQITEQLATITSQLETIQSTLETHATNIQAAASAASAAQTAADAAKTTAGTASSAASAAQTGVESINTRLTNDFLEKG